MADVIRTVQMPGETAFFVTTRSTGQRKGIVTTDRILHQGQHGFHVLVEKLVEQAGHRIRTTHERSGDRRIKLTFAPLFQCGTVHGHKVGTLPSLDIDHLNILPTAQFISAGRASRNSKLFAHRTQRIRQINDGTAG